MVAPVNRIRMCIHCRNQYRDSEDHYWECPAIEQRGYGRQITNRKHREVEELKDELNRILNNLMSLCERCGGIGWRRLCFDCEDAQDAIEKEAKRRLVEHPRYGGPTFYQCCGDERKGSWGWNRESICEPCRDRYARSWRRKQIRSEKVQEAHRKQAERDKEWLRKARMSYREAKALVQNRRLGASTTQGQA